MKAFFDTNILVYAYAADDVVKQAQVISLTAQSSAWISTQVLTEFVNVSARKFKTP